MPYDYAVAMKNVIINSMDQFTSDDSGANIGVGYTGYDNAIEYARANSLDYFGSIYPVTGDDESPAAFGYGIWSWGFYVRMHVKFDVSSSPTPDEKVGSLAEDFMACMLNSNNIHTICPSGNLKVVAANYLGRPMNVSDVTYLTLEFLISIKEQISRT